MPKNILAFDHSSDKLIALPLPPKFHSDDKEGVNRHWEIYVSAITLLTKITEQGFKKE